MVDSQSRRRLFVGEFAVDTGPLSNPANTGYSHIAVSSSLRQWIDVFALPEKFNMAETESDPDSKVRKMPIAF